MTKENGEKNMEERKLAMTFTQEEFAKMVISDLQSSTSGRRVLKNYKQSEVREIVENFQLEANQEKLIEISKILYAKSPQYQRLIRYFGSMATFAHVISPIKNLLNYTKEEVREQYDEFGELLRKMNLRHEMSQLMVSAFIEDVFYGYVHKSKDGFYIQKLDYNMCKITSVEDGVFNYSIDMGVFQRNEDELDNWSNEVKVKYRKWKNSKAKNSKIGNWVELDAKNTICIKINSHMLEKFPFFAGSFDSIFDIDGFKKLRKDREEIGNYMLVTQELPMRKDSENNNDFMIDQDMFMYFHNLASDVVPRNVGVITSPMKIEPLKFEKDRADSDGVAKAERDFWSGSGTSQLLFNADKTTSQGLLMGIKTDEQIVFDVLTQIERWVNRYIKLNVKGEMLFNVDILDVTQFNKKEMFDMYLQASQYGLPVKNHLSATIGLSPIETMSMAYLENDILELHDKFIPLQSSHTMSDKYSKGANGEGRPQKDEDELSDEGSKNRDKPNEQL